MRVLRGEGHERGQAMIESAVTTMVFFLLVLGVVEFGRVMYTYHSVCHAARMGTRYAIVHGYDAGDLPTQDDMSEYVKQQLDVDPNPATVTTTWQDGGKSGTWVQVDVSYAFDFLIPVSSITIDSHSQMYIGQ